MASPASSSTTSSFQTARSRIRSLDDDSLLSSMHELVEKERRLEIHVLLHLSEVERRKLHLDLGFRSMFDYCMQALGYSRSNSGRRLQAARCLTRYPRVARLVERGDLTIATVCLIAPVVSEANERDLLERVRGRTQDQVERILVSFGRKVVVKERVTRVRSTDDQSAGARAAVNQTVGEWGYPGESAVRCGTGAGESAVRPEAGSGSSAPSTSPLTSPPTSPPMPPSVRLTDASETADSSVIPEPAVNPATDPSPSNGAVKDEPAQSEPDRKSEDAESPAPTEKFRLLLIVDAEFMAKLERARALCSGAATREAKIIPTLEAGLDRYLDQNCPVERHKRRERRQQSQLTEQSQDEQGKQEQSQLGSKEAEVRTADESKATSPVSTTPPTPLPQPTELTPPMQPTPSTRPSQPARPNRKPLSIATRDAVLARDGARCTYVGRNGRRCDSTASLEVDHRVPRALGGGDSMNNLRTLCRAHNQREADRILGEDFMARRRGRRVPEWDSASGGGKSDPKTRDPKTSDRKTSDLKTPDPVRPGG